MFWFDCGEFTPLGAAKTCCKWVLKQLGSLFMSLSPNLLGLSFALDSLLLLVGLELSSNYSSLISYDFEWWFGKIGATQCFLGIFEEEEAGD